MIRISAQCTIVIIYMNISSQGLRFLVDFHYGFNIDDPIDGIENM